ncbi:MAG: ATP-binding protein [Phycisphaerae bacterium]|nr:ATP-binding protein [Phycisphaerae bacterium]
MSGGATPERSGANPPSPAQGAGDPSGIEIRCWSRAENLSAIRACVERFAADVGFDEERQARIALAVDEAVANVIRHSYKGQKDGPITLRLAELEGGGVRVELEDEGEAFDPCSIAPRDLAEVKPGGLGIHIIRSTFDRCMWKPRPIRGMAATLEVGLNSPLRSLPSNLSGRMPAAPSDTPDGTDSGHPHSTP